MASFSPHYIQAVTRAAESLGANVVFESFSRCGCLLVGGQRILFTSSDFSLNSNAGARIARNKKWANFFLRQAGYSVPDNLLLMTKAKRRSLSGEYGDHVPSLFSIREAKAFAEQVGYPMIVKPNGRSGGEGVRRASNYVSLARAVGATLKITDQVLVEKYHAGDEYRLLVLDDEILTAYQRFPLTLCGDGRASVEVLLAAKRLEFQDRGYEMHLAPSDPRVQENLAHQGLDLASVLAKGARVRLLDNANVCAGGESRDITPYLHNDYADLARNVARDMGLRLCGLDIVTGDATKPCKDYVILEINSDPGLGYYMPKDTKEEGLVPELLKKVLTRVIETARSGPK